MAALKFGFQIALNSQSVENVALVLYFVHFHLFYNDQTQKNRPLMSFNLFNIICIFQRNLYNNYASYSYFFGILIESFELIKIKC